MSDLNRRTLLLSAVLVPFQAVRGTAANSAVKVGLIDAGGRGTYDASVVVKDPRTRLVDRKEFPPNSCVDGLKLTRQVDHPHVKLLFDVYHEQGAGREYHSHAHRSGAVGGDVSRCPQPRASRTRPGRDKLFQRIQGASANGFQRAGSDKVFPRRRTSGQFDEGPQRLPGDCMCLVRRGV